MMRSNVRPLAALLGILLLLWVQPTAAEGHRVAGTEPALDTEAVRDVGDVIYAAWDEVAARRLAEPFRHQLKKKVAVEAPRGSLLEPDVARREGADCSLEPMVRGKVFGMNLAEVACFHDEDGDGRYDRYIVGPGGTAGSGTAWIDIEGEGPAYEETSRVDAAGFRRELVFLGVDRGTLRIRYREFSGGYARPAFTEDLTYPLAEEGPTVIRYRGFTAEISSVADGRIHYAVKEGLRR